MRFLESLSSPDSQIWLFGIPYDGTSSFRPGSRFGPDAIRIASQGIETYSPYQERDLREVSFYDYGNLELSISSPEKTIEEIHLFAKSLYERGKISLALGGEHTISYPIIKAAFENYPNLKVVQFDAHCDLHSEYGGNRFSHAAVMRRVLDFLPFESYFGFGIRSGDKEEFQFAKKLKNFLPFSLREISPIVKAIERDAPLYITIDLDVLDPSYFPGTGTPEPSGVTVKELLDGILSFKGRRIIGVDLVELSPHYDASDTSSVTASFFVREILLLIG